MTKELKIVQQPPPGPAGSDVVASGGSGAEAHKDDWDQDYDFGKLLSETIRINEENERTGHESGGGTKSNKKRKVYVLTTYL